MIRTYISMRPGWTRDLVTQHLYARGVEHVSRRDARLLVWLPRAEVDALLANFDPAATALTLLRRRRDRLLRDSDWAALPDASPPSGRDGWLTYRQRLRDLPEVGEPLSVTWPEEPS